MAIKQTQLLTRQDFDQSIVKLRLNVSEVAKETGVPRTYLSEFRNGDRQLRPEHQAKLRDYFESKGVEFEDEPEPDSSNDQSKFPLPAQQQAASAPYRFWPVYLDVDQSIAVKVLGLVQDNDAQIAVLLHQPIERNDDFIGDGEFTDETKEALQELIGLFAMNYALFRSLSGWPALGLTPSTEDPQILRDVIFAATFQQQFELAGLVAEPEMEEGDGE